MKFLPVALILLISAVAAWAQYGQTTTPSVLSTTTVMTATGPVCIAPTALPPQCPSFLTLSVTNDPVLLVLGTQEQFVLDNVPTRNLDWRDVPSGYSSIFELGNPLTYTQVNPAVTRHGNPYFPYFAVNTRATVAGLVERYTAATTSTVIAYPGLASQDASILQTVADRYRGLTVSQAMSLGYQPVGAFTPGVEQVYLNRALVSNCLNLLQPQAFVFDRQGRLTAVQYQAISSVPVVLFGQSAHASTVAPGAQQVTVWLWGSNPNGLFATSNPNIQ